MIKHSFYILGLILICIIGVAPDFVKAQDQESVYFKRFVENENGTRIDKNAPDITFTAYLNNDLDSVLIESAPRIENEEKSNIDSTTGAVGVEVQLFPHFRVSDTVYIRVTDRIMEERGVMRQPIDTIPWQDPNPLQKLQLQSGDLPDRPENVELTINNDGEHYVSWNATPGMSYWIYRKNSNEKIFNGSFRNLYTLQAQNVTGDRWQDTDAVGHREYEYIVYEVNEAGRFSAHSEPSSRIKAYLETIVMNGDGTRIDKGPPAITYTAFLNGKQDSILIENAPRINRNAMDNVDSSKGIIGVEAQIFPGFEVGDTVHLRITDNVLNERAKHRKVVDSLPWSQPGDSLDVTRLKTATVPAPPEDVSITVDESHQRTITWNDKQDVSYRIYRTNLNDTLLNGETRNLYTLQAEGITEGTWTDPNTSAAPHFAYLIYPVSSSGVVGPHSSEVLHKRPNILLINIDDLGWKDLGYMGSRYYETPNIDRLAEEGMVFNNAYSAASNCAPSRAALFTGQYAPRTGVYTVGSSKRGDPEDREVVPVANQKFIQDSDLTISEILHNNGYRTAHVGKWHISENPKDYGFDRNAGGLEAGRPNWGDMGGYFSPYNNPNLEDGPNGEYLTDRLTRETISFMKEEDRAPFFINYAPYAVHTPIQPKPELEEKYEQKAGTDAHNNAGYAAMIETMDRNVGRLVDHLKESERYENTLILFTSDNGGVWRITKMWPLRAGKGTYYEGGIRVPMIATWPGVIESGTTSNEVVSNIDFFPTFLDVAGVEKPSNKTLDGVSLLPLFQGDNIEERAVFWHFPIYLGRGYEETVDPEFRTTPGSVVRKGNWKLHQYYEDGHVELYNLNKDIGESDDLSQESPQKKNSLLQQLRNWRESINAPLPSQSTDVKKNNQLNYDFELHHNYPNPFNPSTTIQFSIPRPTQVEVIIYNRVGKMIKTLIDEHRKAGEYQITFSAQNLASGMYFYRLQTENHTKTRRMILLK